MEVPKYRLTRPCFDRCEAEATRKVLASGWVAEGPATERFERKVAEYVGAKHAVAVCNCTAALTLALKASGATGEVAVPAFGHPATVQAALNAGLSPVLHDVNLASRSMTPTLAMTSLHEFVVPVSWGGYPVDVSPDFRHKVVEDAACSLGAEVNGQKTGGAWTACFSFHPRKIVTCGEGAVVTTNSGGVALAVRQLKNFGEEGGNYKLSDLASAVGLCQMDKIERLIQRRVEMARIYGGLLKDAKNVYAPTVRRGFRHTFQTYAVLLKKGDRDTVVERLRKRGVEAQVGGYAMHWLPMFSHLPRAGSLINSEVLDRKLIALPMDYAMTEEDQKHVACELAKASHD